MRVALNVEQLLHEAPGGIGRYTGELLRHLPAVGVEPVPFTARHPRAVVDAALAPWYDGAPATILPLPRPVLYDLWHVAGIAGPGRGVGAVDLVHAPSVAVPPTGKIPLVVTAHDAASVTMPESSTRRGRWFHASGLAAAARRADLVITVSRFAADELSAHSAIPRDRIRVVPNGVDGRRAGEDDVARVREHLGLGVRPYVLWVGVAQPRKNLETLFEAFARLVATSDLPHQLVVAGPQGWLTTHAGSAAVRRVGPRVRLMGEVAADDVAPLLAGADLFAFPSRHEGFGLPVLEAMAQGTAVACADIPALREVAGDAAELVPPDDVEAWVHALARLLDEDDRRQRLEALGPARAALFGWDRCAEATAAVYAEVLRPSSR